MRLTLELRNVEGEIIQDQRCVVTVCRPQGPSLLRVECRLTGQPLIVEIPDAAVDPVWCRIEPSRYRTLQTAPFFRTPGQAVHQLYVLCRQPKQWEAEFVPWLELEQFEYFPDYCQLLHRAALDADPLIRAMTLNIYARAREPWWTWIRRVESMTQERIVAWADPDCLEEVRAIYLDIHKYKGVWKRASTKLHEKNLPDTVLSRITGEWSIKSAQPFAGLQICAFQISGHDEALIDLDLDEHAGLRHVLDVLHHVRTGGTHPYDMHELLKLQQGPGLYLGYCLV